MKYLYRVLFCGVLGAAAPVDAADRFTPFMDGAAVLDTKTGLVWEQAPGSEHLGWADASAYCHSKTTGSRPGWRVPIKEELASLVDASQADPALPADHPFTNVKSAIYWTATAEAKDPILAWHVSFFTGQVTVDGKHLNRRVWCVRDQGA
jgi:hypothetical protein